MDEHIQSLDGQWRLYLAENRSCASFTDAVRQESDLKTRGLSPIPGSVPGNFELDMQRAGLIEDPFWGMNPAKVQELENRHLWYARSFDYAGDAPDQAILRFEGIDTFADIYLNGLHIGAAENMFVRHEYKAEGIRSGVNELLVHIRPACIEARKYPFDLDVNVHQPHNAASLSIRKAAHSFGWDIMPRFVSAGLWRGVFLYEQKRDYIRGLYLHTASADEKRAEIIGTFDIEMSGDLSQDYALIVEGECGDSRFAYRAERLWHDQGAFRFGIDAPRLWWPRDMGQQALYAVKATLLYKGAEVDSYAFQLGVRTVRLERTDLTDKDGSGKFLFYVNDEPVFIRGTNWVPLDAFHSRDAERLPRALELLLESNCNGVRCWGGNVYEDHAFFDFCDRHGILVWQDFAMGCAAYPQDDAFAARLKAEAESVVRKLRQHPSLMLWAGDNECDQFNAYLVGAPKNPDGNRLTRVVLPEVLSRLDPWRPYLPSSPYISSAAYAAGDSNLLPENHLWGPRDYFKSDFYKNTYAHFASETGYHGCPAPASLRRFLSAEKLWPWQGNKEWLAHATCMEPDPTPASTYAYRIPLMANQVKVLFGEEPDALSRFALMSQLSQAEADKYLIEHFRSEKWRRTGIIWWNLIDGWPQFSDAVVDYYYTKKAAFGFIRRSQEPVCLMIREPEEGMLSLAGANEYLCDKAVRYTVTELSAHRVVLQGEALLKANQTVTVAEFPYEDAHRFYLIEWECDGKQYKNHYAAGAVPYDFERYLEHLKEGGLLSLEGFGEA